MITKEQRNKIKNSLKKIDNSDLILMPHYIETKYILKAKTNDARARLVFAAVAATLEDIRRINQL